MKIFIANLSISKAALVIGIAFITSVVVLTVVDDVLLSNFVVPGDTNALARDIEANGWLFLYAAIGYLLVLALDSTIGLALYVVLKPANVTLAALTSFLRVIYAFILAIGVFALVLQIIDVNGYATIKLFGYIFFALHVFFLGYSVFRSGYIPKPIGILLIFASFTYIVFFIDLHLSEILEAITMLMMAIAEFSLSVWLIVKRNKLPASILL
jgi:hypothetical protein